MIKISCRNPIYVNKVIVPCGKCFCCRSKYRLGWQLRLQHELLSYNYCAIFLTLTYNEKNLPINDTLVKKDVQDFIKRLRKYYSDVKIRYFAVGEYGTEKHRPHYHLIVYGLKAPEQKRKSVLNWKYGKFLSENIWKKGYCFVGYVDSKCISYVSKYVLKEFVKGVSVDTYEKCGLQKPFSLKSSGLGLSWLLKNINKVTSDIKQNKPVTMYKSKVGYPRYYRKKLIELGEFDENYFRDKYYDEIDNMQASVISELKEAHVNLDPEKNYLNLSLSDLFNIENATELKTTRVPVKDFIDKYENNPKYKNKYKSYCSLFIKGVSTVPVVDIVPVSRDYIEDVLNNHWFIVYKKYISMKHDLRLKGFILKNKNKVDPYE